MFKRCVVDQIRPNAEERNGSAQATLFERPAIRHPYQHAANDFCGQSNCFLPWISVLVEKCVRFGFHTLIRKKTSPWFNRAQLPNFR
jgi:hypothetical protein